MSKNILDCLTIIKVNPVLIFKIAPESEEEKKKIYSVPKPGDVTCVCCYALDYDNNHCYL